jgi:hypothetical protein
MIEYKLEWEMPDMWWSAGHEHINDFTDIWDQIPWESSTVKTTTDLNSIRDQHKTLKNWETTKTQPIRNVKLSKRVIEPTDWEEIVEVPSITCPRCYRTSYNPNDIEQKYCGNCHMFHKDMPKEVIP